MAPRTTNKKQVASKQKETVQNGATQRATRSKGKLAPASPVKSATRSSSRKGSAKSTNAAEQSPKTVNKASTASKATDKKSASAPKTTTKTASVSKSTNNAATAPKTTNNSATTSKATKKAAPRSTSVSDTKSGETAVKKAKVNVLTMDTFLSTESAEYVLTCGNGDVGQLGHGEDVTVAKRPRLVKSFQKDARFLQAVAGGMHTALLTSDFKVFTCGCNDEGALGRPCYDDNGEQVDKDEDFMFRMVTFPDGTGNIVMISAGDSHTAALTRGGDVFVWGTFRDKGGLLGLALQDKKVGEVVKKTKDPYLLSSNEDRVVVKIASGSNHIAMLTADGKIFTSGAGDAGQLGRLSPHSRDSSISQRSVAKMMTPADIVVKRSIHFTDVWCATYCCFARSVDGKILVWGLNNYRQLGVDDEDKTDIHFPEISQHFGPDKVWEGFAGDHHILAMDNSGKCYGIGRGDDCRFGQGKEKSANSETLIEICGNDVAGVAAATGTSFYWTKSGQGFAWGANNEAELGLAVEEGSVVEKPTLVEPRGINGGCRIQQISANAQHTVFLASHA